MTRLRTHLVVGLALLLPASAQAQEKVVFADCGDAGCACRLTDLTPEDVGLITGTAPPPGAAGMTLVYSNGEYIWSTMTPDEADFAASPWLARTRSNLQIMYQTALAVSHTLDIDQLLQRLASEVAGFLRYFERHIVAAIQHVRKV